MNEKEGEHNMKKNKLTLAAIRSGITALMLRIGTLAAFAVDETTGGGTGGNFANSDIAQGTKNLITDVSTWFILICALGGTAAAIYCLIRRGMADEVDGKMWTKRCITAIICAVGGALVGGVVALVGSYYGI